MPPVPAEPLCSLNDVASFRAGVHNGDGYGPDHLTALVDNFKKFSAGESPHYTPYVSINHDDGLSFGRVHNARLDNGVLKLSASRLPKSVGEWVNSGQLQAPSIEFFEPKKDAAGRVVDGFRDPQGNIVTTPVLKCLTLLGNKPPACKGLGDLPVAKFSQKPYGGIVRQFSGESRTMDRNATIEALKAMGVDTSSFTDAIPDQALQALLTWAQAQSQPAQPPADANAAADQNPPGGATAAGFADANGTPNPNDPFSMPTGQMAQMPYTTKACADGAAEVTGPEALQGWLPPGTPTPGMTGGSQPKMVTMKFADSGSAVSMAGILNGISRQFAHLRTQAATAVAVTGKHVAQTKAAKIKAFKDEMTGGKIVNGAPVAYMTPAQFDALPLGDLNDAAVKKFADGSGSGSALDEAIARIRKANSTPVKKFSEKLNDGGAAAMNGVGGGGPMTVDKIKEICGGDPLGRAAFERYQKAGK